MLYVLVERMSADNWVSACREIEVQGSRGSGKGRKTWQECVTDDMRRLEVRREVANIVQCGWVPF